MDYNLVTKIRGDKLVLATISVLRTLILELHKAGTVDVMSVIGAIDDTAAAHRETGDPNQLADAIEAIASHLRESLSVGKVLRGKCDKSLRQLITRSPVRGHDAPHFGVSLLIRRMYRR